MLAPALFHPGVGVSGFGRKGLAGQPVQPQHYGHAAQDSLEGLRNAARGSFHTQPGNPQMSAKVNAFLAAERARETQPAGNPGVAQAGLSDFAANYRSTAKPARNLTMAFVLWFFAGQVSAHRFYLGAYRSAFAQLGLFALWLTLGISGSAADGAALEPIFLVALAAWSFWILGDVFFIRRLHRQLCRQPDE